MRRGALAVLFGLWLAAGSAAADDAVARQEFRRGVELYDRKQYAEALEAFRAAYREKPSAIIKQNIGLSFRGLGKPVEAATAFDEALDEGRDTLAPETRQAIEREVAELARSIATLEVKVVGAADRRAIPGAKISVDGAHVASGGARPIRLSPGIHVVTAHVDGYGDPPEKKLALVAGSPVDVTFEMGAPVGTVSIRPSVEGCVIRVDGVEVGRGAWSGKLTAGVHRVEVVAPDYLTMVAEISVTTGAVVDYPIAMRRPGEAPPAYELPKREVPVPMKRWYVVVMGAVDGQNLELGEIAGEPPGGTLRDMRGGAGGARLGYRLSRFFALEAHAEAGGLVATYRVRATDARDTEALATHGQLTPALRFSTVGHVRFTAATGVGVHGTTLAVRVPDGANTTTRKGTKVSGSWLLDFGAQVDAGPVNLEGVIFFDVNGSAGVRDGASDERMVLSSTAARVGLRLGVGFAF